MPKQRNVMVMIDLNWPLAHHFHVFAGIDRFARERGHWDYRINPHADQLLKRGNRTGRPDGIVARATRGLMRRAQRAGVPVVNVWLNSPARGLPTVVHDAEESGRMAARHLVSHGFRRFGYLGFARDRCAALQLSGFRDTLAESGYTCISCWTSHHAALNGGRWQRFQAQLDEWISTWTTPLAIFSTNDLLNRYLLDACHRRGLKVPDDVALLGTFNEPMICSRPRPALSSIDFGFERIGYQAAELLDQLMDGAAPPKEPILVKPATVVVRESSNAFAADDPIVAKALHFIGDRLCDELSVDAVARHAAVTSRTLARLFQKSLSKSIHKTIMEMRLERAKRELLETKGALKAIAMRCGFRDAIHLCKVFQREEQTTPSEYRAQRAGSVRLASNENGTE